MSVSVDLDGTTIDSRSGIIRLPMRRKLHPIGRRGCVGWLFLDASIGPSIQFSVAFLEHEMTATQDPWRLQELGVGCYLCPPRLPESLKDFLLSKLCVSSLYLVKDQRFRGMSTLILNDHVTQLDALPEDVYAAYFRDLRVSVRAIRAAVNPDHMNIELLGNSCPHLHWSIAPRYRSDPRWGRPIGDDSTRHEMKNNPVVLPDEQCAQIMDAIRRALSHVANQ